MVRIAPNLNGKHFSVPQNIRSGFFNLDPIENARTHHAIFASPRQTCSKPIFHPLRPQKRPQTLGDCRGWAGVRPPPPLARYDPIERKKAEGLFLPLCSSSLPPQSSISSACSRSASTISATVAPCSYASFSSFSASISYTSIYFTVLPPLCSFSPERM